MVDGPKREPRASASAAPGGLRASQLLRIRPLWIPPIVLSVVLIALMTLAYVGSVVSPVSHLRDLPVVVVNQDLGTDVGTGGAKDQINIGRTVVEALQDSKAVATRLTLDPMTLQQAKAEMDRNGAHAAIVIPRDFTRSTLAIYGEGAANQNIAPLPIVELLNNVRAGSIGVSLTASVAQPALKDISLQIGQTLNRDIPAVGKQSLSATALRANPLVVQPTAYRPLPPHSALGLSAFYISLLTIMCGFLGATLINAAVDSALGYAPTDLGRRWRQRLPVRITRWQTLLAKWVMALVLVPLLVAVMLLVSIGLLNMDASHLPLLWVFLSLAGVAIAFGTLVFFAALGSLGQLVAMLVFVYLALASSGGTIPLEAVPGVFKAVASFEPLRQILDGARSILYFGAAGDAGLTRGFVMALVGLAVALVAGVAITGLYDRKGMHRMAPELMDHLNESVQAYTDATDAEVEAAAGAADETTAK